MVRHVHAFALFGLIGCQQGATVPADAGPPDAWTCATTLYGRPGTTTGLGDDQCGPSCGCGDEAWGEQPWTATRIAALRQWTQLDPPPSLTSDPYDLPAPTPVPGEVCGMVVDDLATHTYRVQTFADATAATAAGAIVTHADACGVCSSLTDLAVYAETLDLTTPVRQCGLDAGSDLEANTVCLEALGFTRPCAEVWAFNTRHTRSECLADCIALLGEPYHEPDGDLNACLLCDEVQSGPVFKAVAGRTRRNTGVASALCRPCNDVQRLDHAYPN